MSNDLCLGIDNPRGLSVANIRYAFRFYELYSRIPLVPEGNAYLQHVVEDNGTGGYLQQVVEDKKNGSHSVQGNDKYLPEIVKVPWGHHTVILGKCKGNQEKALFYVRKTIENGWSRADLQAAIGEELYEKTGKALTNFSETLPTPDGYLAKELVKNEYSFAGGGEGAVLAGLYHILRQLGQSGMRTEKLGNLQRRQVPHPPRQNYAII